MRLFIAIEIPDECKKKLAALRTDIAGARWVPADQVHLTLAFLGEVDESVCERLTAELSRIHSSPFDLHFAGTGSFPNRHRPRVLWIGLEPQPRLLALAAMVRRAVLSCDIPQEERPFSPHITLARFKFPPTREVAAFFDQERTQKIPPIHVSNFTLFQSRLTQQGAVHAPLKNFALVGER